MEGEFWLNISDARVSYANNQILSSMNLAISKGITVIIGKNGIGKSTVIGLAEGLVRISGGKVMVLGKSPRKMPHEAFRRISFLPEEPVSYGPRKVMENIILYSKMRKVVNEKISQLISYFDVEYIMDRDISTLSMGESKLLSLVLCLATDADYYVMDEPSSNLYISNRLKLSRLMRKMNSEDGKTFLITTHIVDEIPYIADTLILATQNGFREEKINVPAEGTNNATTVVIKSLNPEDIFTVLNATINVERRDNEIIVHGISLSQLLDLVPQNVINTIQSIHLYPETLVEAIYE